MSWLGGLAVRIWSAFNFVRPGRAGPQPHQDRQRKSRRTCRHRHGRPRRHRVAWLPSRRSEARSSSSAGPMRAGSPLVELDIGISFSSDASGQYPSKSGRASVRESLLFPVTARPPQRDPSGGISYSCHQLASGGLSRNVYSCAGSATDAPRIDYLRGDPSVDTLCRPVKFVPYLSRRTPATAHQRMALIS
jgi:hypothetical protein